jgi:hypothetical protein
MSKRKTASKHARSPKIAAKAQRAAQAIIKSTKVARRSVSEAAELAPSLIATRNQRLHLHWRLQELPWKKMSLTR